MSREVVKEAFVSVSVCGNWEKREESWNMCNWGLLLL